VEDAPTGDLQEVHDVLVDASEGSLDPFALEARPQLADDVDRGWLGHGGPRRVAPRRRYAAFARVDRDRDPRDDEPLDRDADPDDRDAPVARVRAVPRDPAARGARRSAAGISSVTTAFVSVGISFRRKFAIRSSSRR
jgi:hypothetical protein